MNVTSEFFHFTPRAADAGTSDAQVRRRRWVRVAVWSLALGLLLLLAAKADPLWPAMVSPFLFVGGARRMRWRSLGSPSHSIRPSTTSHQMRVLVESGDEGKRCLAAQELATKKDLRALLVLTDVAADADEKSRVREAARKGLHLMAVLYRKQRVRIATLESAVEREDPQGVIDVLNGSFEMPANTKMQSAYVIGRQYMRLGRYADAREWLTRAGRRGSRSPLYKDRIRRLVAACNEELVAEGDASFEAGDYQGARERYARLSQGLDDQEKQRFAVFLRSACAYCRLDSYSDALQAVLHALKTDQKTEESLTLIQLLQRRQELVDGKAGGQDERRRIETVLDECVMAVMDSLRAA